MVIETARELMHEELGQVAGGGSGIHAPPPPGSPVGGPIRFPGLPPVFPAPQPGPVEPPNPVVPIIPVVPIDLP